MEPMIFSRQSDFDTLHPEENMRVFLDFCREVISRYDGNVYRLGELEAAQQDLLHFIEMTDEESSFAYVELQKIRRERRDCKNENDILRPLYECLKAKQVLEPLSIVLGKTRTAYEVTSKRLYTTRTDVLSGNFEKEQQVE